MGDLLGWRDSIEAQEDCGLCCQEKPTRTAEARVTQRYRLEVNTVKNKSFDRISWCQHKNLPFEQGGEGGGCRLFMHLYIALKRIAPPF